MIICVGAVSVTAVAQTTLFDNGVWVVQGATDTGPDARDMAVSIEGAPAGSYSELKIFRAFTGAGVPQVFSIKGSGALQASMPPPGVFGGSFYLTGYWDCIDGLVPKMVITSLDLTAGNDKTLKFQGSATNLTSFETDDFKLKFLQADTESVRVEVSYTLFATRDFCIDPSRQQLLEGFQVARIAANFISETENDDNLASFYAVLSKICGCCGCVKSIGTVCATLTNDDHYIFCVPDYMADPHLYLVHTNIQPQNTPTLALHFRKPSPKHINPQGTVVQSNDPDEDNVTVWGNWPDAKPSYMTGEKIGKFKFNVEAFFPAPYGCNVDACL